jgi:MgtC family
MSWLLESWHRLLPEPLAAIFLALVAVFCGAWVGIERERKEKPAGLRTMALVSLGSSVFTMVGYVFTSNSGDSGRVAAQIVAGIGFLGGGILLKGPGASRGQQLPQRFGPLPRWACPSALDMCLREPGAEVWISNSNSRGVVRTVSFCFGCDPRGRCDRTHPQR